MIFDQLPPRRMSDRVPPNVWVFVINILMGVGAVWFATRKDSTYGPALFVVLPIVSGFVGTLICGWKNPLGSKEAAFVSAVSVTFVGLGILTMQMEGMICLIMSAPLAYPAAILGGLIACSVLDRIHDSRKFKATMMLVIMLPFGTIQWERVFPAEPPVYEVTSSVDIAAPPEKVWNALVHPYRLQRSDDLVFQVGIAYPTGAWIEGTGTDATRYCDFSTGQFVEPIREWRENELLRFEVVKNVPVMQEWNPFAEIHPPHLEGFMVTRQGQFRLTKIPGGTRLEGTTWYQHGLQPAGYWRWWSDAIIHRIHGVILGELKEIAERG